MPKVAERATNLDRIWADMDKEWLKRGHTKKFDRLADSARAEIAAMRIELDEIEERLPG